MKQEELFYSNNSSEKEEDIFFSNQEKKNMNHQQFTKEVENLLDKEHRKINSTKNFYKNRKNKFCTYCGTNNTPMWRKGPQGKGTLCNACGVKWSLLIREKIPKKKKISYSEGLYLIYLKKINNFYLIENNQKEYYCKYCNSKWPTHYFKNTQQFGAHCSNCSRKNKGNLKIIFFSIIKKI